MQEISNNQSTEQSYTEIELKDLLNIILSGRRIIFYLTALISLTALIFSLFLPNTYESKALIAPINSSNGISGNLGGYSALAGLAGISLPSGSNEDNSSKAIKKISSLSFFENSILPNIYLPNLMAVKSWNPKLNIITYDKTIFDADKKIWVRDYGYPQKQIPSAQESYKKFITKHIRLTEDKNSGFITLTIKHQSPYLAQRWTQIVFDEINLFYKQKDKKESEKAVIFLNQQIATTALSEVKVVLAELLQEEIKKLSLIEAKQSYVFDYIDPPAIMELKSEPNRLLICFLGVLFGFIFSLVAVIFRHHYFAR